jgi:hypothetical protein
MLRGEDEQVGPQGDGGAQSAVRAEVHTDGVDARLGVHDELIGRDRRGMLLRYSRR